jgi:cold shock CspA family protein
MKWSSTLPSEGKIFTLRAKMVTEIGGDLVCLQDRVDLEKKEFVHGEQNLRYTGILKFYIPKQGYGYVTIDDGYELEQDVPTELRVELHEVNCGGKRPTTFIENTPVEFGIVKNKKGTYMAYNMTLPGGIAMTKANLEHRQFYGDVTFSGTVTHIHFKQGWGLITPEDNSLFPEHIQQALVQQQRQSWEKARQKAAKNAKPESQIEEPSMPDQAFYFSKPDVVKGVVLTLALFTCPCGVFTSTPCTPDACPVLII